MNEEINKPKKVVVVTTEQSKNNNPSKYKNGICIGNTYINTLSGPVSLFYLKPSDQVLASELHLFPTIMLFGDMHGSMENTCECAKSTERSSLPKYFRNVSKVSIQIVILYQI